MSTRSIQLNGLVPMSSLNLERFIGDWKEHKRKDSKFESNVDYVAAKYSIRLDGLVGVLNSGVDKSNGKIVSITGTARRTSVNGTLLVSFFPLIESEYVVLYAAEDDGIEAPYSMVVVASPQDRLVWLLNRRNDVTQREIDLFEYIALNNGFTRAELDELTNVKH